MSYLVLLIGLLSLAALMLGTEWSVFGLGFMIASGGSLVYLTLKAESAHRQLGDLHRLRAAHDQLDQQAKLIIRTDLELHRAQEELDRRLASLMSLHQLGRQLQVSLRPEEVYEKLDASVVTSFGFPKALLGLCTSWESLDWRSLIGVSAAVAEQVHSHILTNHVVKQTLMAPAPQLLKAASAHPPALHRLLELLEVPSAVIAGVMPHTGPAGLLLLGRAGGAPQNPKADEELVAILVNQLAVAVENSALYEKAWASQQDLERSVQDRTRELAAANDALVRLNRSKSDFVSAVSHELRTPLAAIKGYASLLGTGQFGPLADAQRERIAKIERHADLLTQLITDLLDIARIESGRVTMEHNRIQVEELLSTVQDAVHPQLEAKRLRYAVDLDGVRELVGDPQHLRRAFINLLSNAVKYTPEGGSIRVALTREPDGVVASVSDTGYGIAPEEVPKLFQEFYRVNDPVNQQIRGTGLGLALVKRIVEAHHGRVWVTSEKGKGSTFHLSLPAASPQELVGDGAEDR